MLKIREESFEVLYADELTPLVAREDLAIVEKRVEGARFKRARLCVHATRSDMLQEMFIVQCPATYIRPHKHLDKAESLLVLAGSADVVFFDETGEITRLVRVGDYASGRPFFYRIGQAVYHSLIIRTPTFVFKEATQGPFDKSKTEFAPWAPAEVDSTAVSDYRRMLLDRMTLFPPP